MSSHFSVSQITSIVKELIEANIQEISVEGEVSNFRPNAGGHLYFVLKDENAQIGAVMFKSKAANLSFKLSDGMKVRATGTVQVYAPQGRYQLVISKMEIAGIGDILQMIEERKRKLADEGLFSLERKKPLPDFPKTVGVVTSPTGAAVRDIMQIAKRRNSGIDVIVFPAVVQGGEAAKSIAKQIRTANEFSMCDVLIIGRGGGSIEDLLGFSDETVVRAIADSKIPTVSAVGHDIDWSLADFAADVRAPTPSAAAELVFPLKEEISAEIESLAQNISDGILSKIAENRISLRAFDRESMEIRMKSMILPISARLKTAENQISVEMNSKIESSRTKIFIAKRTLEDSSPKTILSRGYALVKKENGKIAKSQSEIEIGENVKIALFDGEISAKRIS